MFFSKVISSRDSLLLIGQTHLEYKVWNMLTERQSIILRQKIDSIPGIKDQFKQKIFSVLLEDLNSLYNYYKNIYLMIVDNPFADKLVSTILMFLGEIKKLKLILMKKFDKKVEYAKDAKEAIRFYNYAMAKNPYNSKVFFNSGFVYREFLQDYTTSSYWFVRSLAAPDNDMKRLKENLEKDFNIIRKLFQEKDYLVDDNPGFLNYDVEYLPLLFHRIMGILYMNIDIDKLDLLMENFNLIFEKILKFFNNIKDETRLDYENQMLIEQLVIMTIFNFHYNLNNLDGYSNSNEKILLTSEANSKESDEINQSKDNKEDLSLSVNLQCDIKLSFQLFSHNILNFSNKEDMSNVKYGFRYVCNIIRSMVKLLAENYNFENQVFTEKILLMFLYWFSINYDVFKFVINNDDEVISNLRFIAFKVNEDLKVLNAEEKERYSALINKYITSLESHLISFRPTMRFFELSNKSIPLKIDEIKDTSNINKIALAYFLSLFALAPSTSMEKEEKFNQAERQLITTTVIKDINDKTDQSQSFISLNMSMLNKSGKVLNVKKVRPLILLDMANIAMRHGNSINFSTKGIQLALDFFTKNGHEVSGFLPEYLFKEEIKSSRKRLIPDNIGYLNDLWAKGLVIQTPAQDYDDSYNILYCKSKNAYFVSNDLYRDYIEKISDFRQRETEKRWVISKRISYTFNKDEFIPGPDSEFFKNFDYLQYCETGNN